MKKLRKKIAALFLLTIYLLGNPTTMVLAETISNSNNENNNTEEREPVSKVLVGYDKDQKEFDPENPDTERQDENGNLKLLEGDIVIEKSVTPDPDGEDGDYIISFKAIGEDTTETKAHSIYSIVVLDVSNSMLGEKIVDARAGLTQYVDTLYNYKDEEGNILTDKPNMFSFVTFGKNAEIVRESFGPEKMTDAEFAKFEAKTQGGTRYDLAIDAAKQVIDNSEIPEDAKVVVVFIGDGSTEYRHNIYPKFTSGAEQKDEYRKFFEKENGSLDNLKKRNDTTIISIGYDMGAEGTRIPERALMRNISTNKYVENGKDRNGNPIYKITEDNFEKADAGKLAEKMAAIATELAKHPAATNLKIKEVLKPEFEFNGENTDEKDIELNGDPITFKISIKKQNDGTYLDSGVYDTNVHDPIDKNNPNQQTTILSYNNINGDNKSVAITKTPSVKYERSELKYNVQYHYQNVNGSDYEDGELLSNINALYGETINKDNIKEGTTTYEAYGNKDGFTYSRQEVIDGLTKNGQTLHLYYTRNNYNYTVNYFYEKVKYTDNNDRFELDGTNDYSAVYGATIDGTQYEKAGLKDGFTHNSTSPAELTIDTEHNVINIYYTRNIYNYCVEHVYAGTKDESKTDTASAKFEDQITSVTIKEIDGYVHSSTETLPFTISNNEENNIITVNYVKRTDLSYTVKYYYQSVDGTTYKEGPINNYDNVEFETVITNNTEVLVDGSNKTLEAIGEKEGFTYDSANAGYSDLTIGTNNDENVINLYYNRNELKYNVKYHYQNVEGTDYEDGELLSDITTLYGTEVTKDSNKDENTTYVEYGNKEGFTFEKSEPITVTEDGMTIDIYYTRNELKYNVQYHYQNVEGTDYEDGETLSDITTLYGTEISKDSNKDENTTYVEYGVKEGFTFEKSEPITVTEEGMTLDIYYTRNNYEYTVNYFYENVDDNDFTLENTKNYDAVYGTIIDSTDYEAEGLKTGFTHNSTDPVELTIGTKNNVINIYYTRNIYNYCVEHVYAGTKDESKTDKDSAKFGAIINDFTKKEKDGYVFDNVQNKPLTISEKEENNVITVNYVKRTDLSYTVKYYYQSVDGTTYEEGPINNYDNVEFETVITNNTEVLVDGSNKTLEAIGEKDGFTYDSANAGYSDLTIGTNNDENVINLYYNRNELKYNVKYHYQNVEGTDYEDGKSLSDIATLFGTEVTKDSNKDENTTYVEYGNKEGFTFEKSDPITVTEDGMTLNIYYNRNSYSYTVNYYFDNVLDESLTETNEALFESEISEYTDKVKEDYIFNKVENLPLTISAKEEDNVINVYYITNAKEIPIEIPQTGVNINSKNGFGILMIIFNLLALCFITKSKED